MSNVKLNAVFGLLLMCVASCALPRLGGEDTGEVADAGGGTRPLVCIVARNTRDYEGQTITLEGRLKTDFNQGLGISHDGCLSAYVLLGTALPGEVGGAEFIEAWRVSASCPHDALYFTVTGVIRPFRIHGRQTLAMYTSEFRDIHRAAGSNCPTTLSGYNEQTESAS